MSLLDQVMEEQGKYELTDEYKNLRSNLKIRDVQKLESEIATLKAQLKREVDCVDFYAGEYNWKTNSGRGFNLGENGNYLTICGDFTQLREELNHRVGGKFARETVKAREL